MQCFKGDKAIQGELGTPGRLGAPRRQGVAVAQGELGPPEPRCRLGNTFRTMIICNDPLYPPMLVQPPANQWVCYTTPSGTVN